MPERAGVIGMLTGDLLCCGFTLVVRSFPWVPTMENKNNNEMMQTIIP